MIMSSKMKKNAIGMSIGITVLIGLYLSSLYNYLLFHSLAELFSIVVACGIFMLAFNSQRFAKNAYMLFLGIAYLFIALMDLVHTLGYTGSPNWRSHSMSTPMVCPI